MGNPLNTRFSKKRRRWGQLGILLALLPGLAAAEMESRGRDHSLDIKTPPAWGTHWALGFLYPGVSARVTYRHLSLEGLYMHTQDADAYGPRVYYLLNPGSRVVFNGGVEYVVVDGQTDLQPYAGRAMTGFLGMELFSTRRVSVGIDMGLSRVSLEGDRGRQTDETSLVSNISLRCYL